MTETPDKGGTLRGTTVVRGTLTRTPGVWRREGIQVNAPWASDKYLPLGPKVASLPLCTAQCLTY